MTILFLKAHVKGYTRRDGTVVKPHQRAEQQSLFPEPERAAVPPNRFKGVDPKSATPDMFDDSVRTPPKRDLPTIEHDGDTWYVVSIGAAREDGKVMVNLSSATRGRMVAGGVQPLQKIDWVDRLNLPRTVLAKAMVFLSAA